MTAELVAKPTNVQQQELPCQERDPELFFADTPATIEYAKGVCLPCPLRAECLAGALRRAEPHGVWGGELLEAGQVVARKRPRGRPRKVPLPVVAAAPEHLLASPMGSRRRVLAHEGAASSAA